MGMNGNGLFEAWWVCEGRSDEGALPMYLANVLLETLELQRT